VFLGSLVTAPASVAYWMESDFNNVGKKLTTICDLRQTHARAARMVCGKSVCGTANPVISTSTVPLVAPGSFKQAKGFNRISAGDNTSPRIPT